MGLNRDLLLVLISNWMEPNLQFVKFCRTSLPRIGLRKVFQWQTAGWWQRSTSQSHNENDDKSILYESFAVFKGTVCFFCWSVGTPLGCQQLSQQSSGTLLAEPQGGLGPHLPCRRFFFVCWVLLTDLSLRFWEFLPSFPKKKRKQTQKSSK